MEKSIEVIQITITPGPFVSWLEKITIVENGTILAEKLERKNYLEGQVVEIPSLVSEIIEALQDIDWPIPNIIQFP